MAADYAIGDIQGCYDSLQRLLEHIQFDDQKDRLWFVGDLVNRGPDSLAVLRFIKGLVAQRPFITLGNHDLYFLYRLFSYSPKKKERDDSLYTLLSAPDGEELGHWLRKQALLHYDFALNTVMCHAGIPPIWRLEEARAYAQEVEMVLSQDNYREFLTAMYGNEPHCWTKELTGVPRWRLIINYFTRMRFCDREGCLLFDYNGTLKEAPPNYIPWYCHPLRKPLPVDIVFGHWAALAGESPVPGIYAIDTGCLWGGKLTALRLQDKQRFTVAGLT